MVRLQAQSPSSLRLLNPTTEDNRNAHPNSSLAPQGSLVLKQAHRPGELSLGFGSLPNNPEVPPFPYLFSTQGKGKTKAPSGDM